MRLSKNLENKIPSNPHWKDQLMRVKVHVQFLGILEESFARSDIMNTENY